MKLHSSGMLRTRAITMYRRCGDTIGPSFKGQEFLDFTYDVFDKSVHLLDGEQVILLATAGAERSRVLGAQTLCAFHC
jgi:hypothetical protein